MSFLVLFIFLKHTMCLCTYSMCFSKIIYVSCSFNTYYSYCSVSALIAPLSYAFGSSIFFICGGGGGVVIICTFNLPMHS